LNELAVVFFINLLLLDRMRLHKPFRFWFKNWIPNPFSPFQIHHRMSNREHFVYSSVMIEMKLKFNRSII